MFRSTNGVRYLTRKDYHSLSRITDSIRHSLTLFDDSKKDELAKIFNFNLKWFGRSTRKRVNDKLRGQRFINRRYMTLLHITLHKFLKIMVGLCVEKF